MHTFRQWIEAAQPAASVIISVALMLLSGFLMTRLTKLLRLPNVTAYIILQQSLTKHNTECTLK